MIDFDYDLLCGQPKLKTIYYHGAWLQVIATDIGRAPQPASPRTGNEVLDQRERFDIDTPHSQDKRAHVRRAIISCLREQPEGMNVRQLADATGINAKQIANMLSKNKHIFATWRGPHTSGPGITWAKLHREAL